MRCPTCKTKIQSLRLTPSGVRYFCDQCGKRLAPEEVLRPPSRNGNVVSASPKTARKNPPEVKPLPAGLLPTGVRPRPPSAFRESGMISLVVKIAQAGTQ